MGLTIEQLEAVLAHELAHIRRHDYLVNILQMIVETLLFYHPAVWWVSNRLRIERELCCDDEAVRACGDATVYARALVNLSKRQVAPWRWPPRGIVERSRRVLLGLHVRDSRRSAPLLFVFVAVTVIVTTFATISGQTKQPRSTSRPSSRFRRTFRDRLRRRSCPVASFAGRAYRCSSSSLGRTTSRGNSLLATPSC
jgi:beta-lactamase regulating signal transducer with metallopeptidase domain